MSLRHLYMLETTYTSLNSEQIGAVEKACLGGGYTTKKEASVSVIVERLKRYPNCMTLIDVHSLNNILLETNFIINSQVIIIATKRESGNIIQDDSKISNLRYLVSMSVPPLAEIALSTILEFKMVGKGAIYDKCFDADELTHSKQINLRDSTERSVVQDKVTDFFSGALEAGKDKLASGISNYPKHLGDIVDEFLMNAIWDASPIREHVDRSLPVKLSDSESVIIDCGFDGKNISLAVTDNHGTFPLRAFSKPLHFALGLLESATVNEGPGGAGLGLYMILQKVALLAFEVKRGKATRAIAVLRADQAYRDLQKNPRTVLFFES